MSLHNVAASRRNSAEAQNRRLGQRRLGSEHLSESQDPNRPKDDEPSETDSKADTALERYRPYLCVLARMQLATSVQARLDASDIVQQTMLQAHTARHSFRGASEGEWTAWLRQILARNLAHALRDNRRDKRDVRREQVVEAELTRSSARMFDVIAGSDASPEKRAGLEEQLLRLAAALDSLPDAQRSAVELHYLQGLSVSAVAARLDRTVAAVGGLLHRGLKRLRERLPAED